ncbi:MAG: hypothetical protein ACLRSF_06790 [Romboutsia timonensis]|uniref:hypothetical protein n=1 Tax=Romboutsia timonensis TaxID=1776391 RepID=UPI0039906333
MKIVKTEEFYKCDICKRELTHLEYESSAKMTVTLNIPSKRGHCSSYTGVDKIDVCEECIIGFGFVYDDPYVGNHQRMTDRLKNTYSDIITKVKLKFKFDAIK